METEPSAHPRLRACVIGQPIAHSRSPLIHGHWLRELGIDGLYDRREVMPADLPAFIAGLADEGLAGCNVTLPHKEAVLPLVRHVSEAASMLGAANTLWVDGGILHADNTDVSGFLAHLDETCPDWPGLVEQALVLGAGGAARAIIHGLLRRNVPQVVVANRSLGKAEAIAARFGPRVTAVPMPPPAATLARVDLIVNTTSLGMVGQPPLDLDLSGVQRTAIVYDLVYVPLRTPLLQAAERAGLRQVDGLGMLLHQAVDGFEHWFGRRPVVTPALRRLLEADLGH